MDVKPLSLKQLTHLAICAFGIQFATALQMANMSSLYKFLGASNHNLSYLWLAAPISGLLVQPLVGQMSDSTWTRYGKRIPYIFCWGILATIALCLMPFSSAVWMAALLLWVLDCSINGSTETLRALTADIAPVQQKPRAFAMQTIFAGVGAGIAAGLPWLFGHFINEKNLAAYTIPPAIKISFVIGGVVLIASIIWTIRNIKEKPFKKKHLLTEKKRHQHKSNSKKLKQFFNEIIYNIKHMPPVIRKFYLIQIFTWVGLFCLFMYFGLAIAQQVFGLTPGSSVTNNKEYAALLTKGTEWAGVCFGIYQFVSVIYAMILPYLADKTTPKFIHGLSLVLGALGIISIIFIHHPLYVILSAIGIGMMWGSIMTMPYAIISAELPRAKMGVYLGIFNITITLPQIISGLLLGFITTKLFHGYAAYTLAMGGVFILIGGILLIRQDGWLSRIGLSTKSVSSLLTGGASEKTV